MKNVVLVIRVSAWMRFEWAREVELGLCGGWHDPRVIGELSIAVC